MGWLTGRLRRTKKRPARAVDDQTVRYLTDFVRSHRGVEAYVEPPTVVTQTTVLLIAYDGEWTRRRVPSPEWAHRFAEQLQIPGYDAAVVGYPQRMRDYNHRQRILARRQEGRTEGR